MRVNYKKMRYFLQRRPVFTSKKGETAQLPLPPNCHWAPQPPYSREYGSARLVQALSGYADSNC
jgi:hypothetical protein